MSWRKEKLLETLEVLGQSLFLTEGLAGFPDMTEFINPPCGMMGLRFFHPNLNGEWLVQPLKDARHGAL